MKYLIVMMLLFSCGKIDRVVTEFTGNLTYKCSKRGVEYIQSDSGIAVSFDQSGGIVKCRP